MTAPLLQNRREFDPFAKTTGLDLYRKAVTAVPQGLTFPYQANPLGATIKAAHAAVLGHAFFQHSRDEFANAL